MRHSQGTSVIVIIMTRFPQVDARLINYIMHMTLWCKIFHLPTELIRWPTTTLYHVYSNNVCPLHYPPGNGFWNAGQSQSQNSVISNVWLTACFRLTRKATPKLHIIGPLWGILQQRVVKANNASIPWRHHVTINDHTGGPGVWLLFRSNRMLMWIETDLLYPYLRGFLHWRCGNYAIHAIFIMMTSSNGNIFRVTGPLCGAFTGPSEFPSQRPVTRSFDVFFDLSPN